ncbi:MAG: SIMPL domain-containing protein [Patescibacteria group bacterium]
MEEEKNLNLKPPKWGLVLMTIVAVLLSVYLISLTRNSWRVYDYIGKSPDIKDRVTVDGTGKVTAKPDIAQISIGVLTEKGTVKEAQKENTDKMNAITKALKDQFRIEDKDIQTSNFSVSPKYDWSDGRQRIIGYIVNQSVEVKVRNFDKIGEILAKAGELGANSVNGPQFTIDDPEVYRQEAREKAIKQAKEKAKTLADQVGIKLGRIVNFSEAMAGDYPIAYTLGLGIGGGASEKALPAPDIQAGSEEVVVYVSISYEIK